MARQAEAKEIGSQLLQGLERAGLKVVRKSKREQDREIVLRAIREELGNWPDRQEDEPFSEFVGKLDRAHELMTMLAAVEYEALLAHEPLELSPEQRSAARVVLKNLVSNHPCATVQELLWLLASQSAPAGRKGRRPVWAGADGLQLIQFVESGLAAYGLRSTDRKAVRRVIGELRDRVADPYQRWSEEELRQGYYLAKRAQSKNPTN